MINSIYTFEETARILKVLDDNGYPFTNYHFTYENGMPKLIGKGGFAYVYQACSGDIHDKKEYAVKVIGFKNENADKEQFRATVSLQDDMVFSENVVRIIDSAELWIIFDTDSNILNVSQEEPEKPDAALNLQFIIMEKHQPLIERTRSKNIRVFQDALKNADEHEILRLAFDIGSALKSAHSRKILHRDIKLENIFYDTHAKSYRLGDFGMATDTLYGVSETSGLTHGYAAPEVCGPQRVNDETSDIYSFGMTLYILSNEMKFPDSNSYSFNPVQYTSGYVFPDPSGPVSERLVKIIRKACMYDSKDRYQDMSEMLADIRTAMTGDKLTDLKARMKDHLSAGILFLAAGAVSFGFFVTPDAAVHYTVPETVFMVLCIIRAFFIFKDESAVLSGICSVFIFLLGVFSIITGGFSWLKVLFAAAAVFSRAAPLEISVFMVISRILSVSGISEKIVFDFDTDSFRWISFVFFGFSAIFLEYYFFKTEKQRSFIEQFSDNSMLFNRYKIRYHLLFMIIWTGMYVFSVMVTKERSILYSMILGEERLESLRQIFINYNVRTACLTGLVTALLWVIKEYAVSLFNKYVTDQISDI